MIQFIDWIVKTISFVDNQFRKYIHHWIGREPTEVIVKITTSMAANK